MQSERGRRRYPSAETTDVDLVLLVTLGGLALLDSTSIGTLVVPVWMLLMPGRPHVRRLLIYLVVITTFYFVVGRQSGRRHGQACLSSPRCSKPPQPAVRS